MKCPSSIASQRRIVKPTQTTFIRNRRLAEQAKAERDEFDRIIEVQILQEDAEKMKQFNERKARMEHCDELRNQVGIF